MRARDEEATRYWIVAADHYSHASGRHHVIARSFLAWSADSQAGATVDDAIGATVREAVTLA
jgi:hypothetical protein